MNIKLLHTTLFLSLCAALAACSTDDALVDDIHDVKTPIEISVGGVDATASTRAVATDGTTNTTFGRDTKIFFLMQSEKDATEHNEFEYKGDRANKLYSVCRGDVIHSTNATAITFDATNQRYWDDAHARSSQLTLWAFAQRIAQTNVDGTWKNCSFQSFDGTTPSLEETKKLEFNTTNTKTSDNIPLNFQSTNPIYPAIFSWNVGNGSQNQDANTIIYQDLLFSNNIANYIDNTKVPEGARNDNRMKFDFSTHKFPATTEMKFYHAMSKITIQIKAGDGFAADGNDFKLKNNTIDLLHGINTRGLFNIKDGEFQMIHESKDITSIPVTKTVIGKEEPYYTLEALAIPNIHQFKKEHGGDDKSRFVDGSDDVMLQLTIDNNVYKITSNALFDAVTGKANATTLTDNGTYVPLEAGKNYVFTFTIEKTKISGLTAQVQEWETVTADNITPSNARISLKLEERGDYITSGADFYRAKDTGNTSISDSYEGYAWNTGYNSDGKATDTSCDGTTHKWSTPNWYWPDNTTFYHFRALAPTTQSITTDTNDYTTLTAGESYTDVRWGAPFLDNLDDEVSGSYKLYYDTTSGFDATGDGSPNASHQIFKGIGPTNDIVKLLMFHMMSELTINVKSVTGDAAVKLTDGSKKTTIHFENIHTSGIVAMGNGLVSTSGDAVNTANLTTETDNKWVYGAIPQSLKDVVLVITTADNNEYRVAMKDVVATTALSGNNVKYPEYTDNKINYWHPGVKYTYNFTLKKTGITNLQATIVQWDAVTADNEDVQIK